MEGEMESLSAEMPILIGQTGPLNGLRWIISDSVTVGREANCDIVIPDRRVSRRHARLTNNLDGVFLEDLRSKNGTHYNGRTIKEPILLNDGDIIQIALAQQFIYISADATTPLEESDLAVMLELTGRLRLEKRSRRVWIGENEVLPPLSVAQFSLLEQLYERSHRVVPRQDLIQGIWGDEAAVDVTNQALDALVRRLRDRLANVDPSHQYVVTIRGHGLRLDNPTSK
jgi:hypothetical protein